MREREDGETVVEDVDASAMLSTAIRYAVDEAVAAKRHGCSREVAELAGVLRTLEIDVRELGKRVENFGQQSGSCTAAVSERLAELTENIAINRESELRRWTKLHGKVEDLDGAGRRLADRVWAVEHLDRMPTTLAGRLRWLILGR